MRIGTFTMFQDFSINQEKSLTQLNYTNKQISSGKKIDYGFEDVNIGTNVLRLDQEEITLKQNSNSSDMAQTFAQNTDSTLNNFVDTLQQFKVKMVKAASNSNSSTDLRAITQELIGLRDHLINLGNTSINGQYLFSGSAFARKPLDQEGNYFGNDKEVKALINSGVQLAYNIDGKSLFSGSDNDYNRLVSTNVPRKNITKLYAIPPEDTFVKITDTISDLTGNNGDGNQSYFYISGTLSSGTSFKQTISLSKDAKVQDLLDRIKGCYKNQADITLNSNGQIEVKDLVNGSSKLEFHIVGSDNCIPVSSTISTVSAGDTKITLNDASSLAAGDKINIDGIGQYTIDSVVGNDVVLTQPLIKTSGSGVLSVNVKKVLATVPTDIIDLAKNGVGITEFIKSGAGPRTLSSTVAHGDYFDHRKFNFNFEFRRKDSEATALTGDLVSSLIDGKPSDLQISLNGQAPINLKLDDKSNLNQLVDSVQDQLDAKFGLAKFTASYVGGKLVVYDNSIPESQAQLKTSALNSITLSDASGAATFSAATGVETDRSRFERSGAYLKSNISQIVNATNEYAKPSDTLLSTAGTTTLDGTSMTMDVTTITGDKLSVSLDFSSTGSTFTVGGNKYPILSATPTKTPTATESGRGATPADQVTYQQLMDVISMVMGSSNSFPATAPADLTNLSVADATSYDGTVTSAQFRAGVTLDNKGQIVIQDKVAVTSQATFALYDKTITGGYTSLLVQNTASLSFNSNKALVVDDPKIDLFGQLQKMIDAVSSGKTRTTNEGNDNRNIGMQNGLKVLDHLYDHVIRKHTDIGAVSNSFQMNKDRTETLLVNVKMIRSQILDTDFAEASLQLNQKMLNYQALLSLATKINSLSLTNYLK